MLKKFLSIVTALALTLTLLPAAALAAEADVAAPTAATVFTDVDGHWAEGAISRWSNYGVVQGSAGRFDPNGGLTCAQMATILDNLLRLGAAGSAGFTDVAPNAWYAGAINRCAAAGILNGNGDGTVDPDSPITRERAMVILARALGIAPKANADLKSYSDREAVSGYAAPYVAALIDAGIVSGMTDTTLAPQDGINRASTVTILDRAISTYANEKGASVAASGEGITLVVADEVTVTGDAGTLLVPTDNINVTLDGSKAADHVAISGDNATVTVKSTAVESANVSGENSKLILESSNAGEVTVSGAKSSVETKGTTTVETVSVTEEAEGATVSAGSGTTVKSVENDAKDTTVTGAGKVSDVKSSTDVTVETKNTDVKNTGDETITVTDKNGKDADVSTGSGSSSSTTVNQDTTTVSGGSSSGGSSHSHSYAEGWTYDETDHWHASACGHDVVSGKAAHTWNDGEVTKDATCAAAGEKLLKCTVCGAEKVESIPATGAHVWNDGVETKKPTELVKGEMTYTCTVCGATKTEEIIATGEHDLVHHAAAKADCHAPGTPGNVEYWECRECGKLFTDESGASAYEVSADTVVIQPTHTIVEDAAVAATCTTDGLTAGKSCSVCGAVLVAQEVVPALGHDEAYESVGECKRCGAVNPDKAAAKIGETYYLKLSKAMAAAEDGNTIVLLQNTNESGIDIPASLKTKGVTLDLNGKTLSGNDTIFYVSGKLYIQNSGDAATGSVTSSDRAFYLNNGSAVTLRAGVAVHSDDRPIVVEPNATLTVAKGASVEGNPDETEEGIVIICQGTVNVQSGSTVTGHGYGSAIWVDSGKLTVYGTVEQTGLAGAAIETRSTDATVTIGVGATIKATNANECPKGNPGIAAVSMLYGGKVTVSGKIEAGMKYGVHVADSGTLTVKGGEITGSATAVYVESGTADLSGGTFRVSNEGNKTYLLNCYDANYTAGTAKIVVTGGTYEGYDPAHSASESPEANFVKDGYVSQADGAGNYTVVKVGSTADAPIEISTPEQALAMKSTPGYYKLVSNVEVTNEINLTGASKQWFLDLNDHSITLKYSETAKPNNGGVFNVTGSAYNKRASLTISDSGENQTGAVIGSATDYANKVMSAVRAGKYSTLTINGGHFYAKGQNSCIFVFTSTSSNDYATVVINGGAFETAEALNGRYYVLNHQDGNSAGCTITVNGGTFKNYKPGETGVDPANAYTGTIKLGTNRGIRETTDGNDTWYTVEQPAQ